MAVGSDDRRTAVSRSETWTNSQVFMCFSIELKLCINHRFLKIALLLQVVWSLSSQRPQRAIGQLYINLDRTISAVYESRNAIEFRTLPWRGFLCFEQFIEYKWFVKVSHLVAYAVRGVNHVTAPDYMGPGANLFEGTSIIGCWCETRRCFSHHFCMLVLLIRLFIRLRHLTLAAILMPFAAVYFSTLIRLVAPTISCLRALLRTCETYLNDVDMCVNVKIAQCFWFGRRYNTHCTVLTTVSGGVIKYVDCCRYLGVFQ